MGHRGRLDPPRGIPLPGHHLHLWDQGRTRLTGPSPRSRQGSGSSSVSEADAWEKRPKMQDGHQRHTDGLLSNSLLEDWQLSLIHGRSTAQYSPLLRNVSFSKGYAVMVRVSGSRRKNITV
jgi:hypothetical protein